MGAKFSVPVQTGAKAHPALCTIGTPSFQQVVQPGHGADHSLCSSAKAANGFDLRLHLHSMHVLGVTFTITKGDKFGMLCVGSPITYWVLQEVLKALFPGQRELVTSPPSPKLSL